MSEPNVKCEKVVLDKDEAEETEWLVQYEDTPEEDRIRDNTIQYLSDCGHTVTTEPHAVVGPNDEPAVSWGDLSDIVEPRDD